MSPSSKVSPIFRFFLKLPHSGEHLPKGTQRFKTENLSDISKRKFGAAPFSEEQFLQSLQCDGTNATVQVQEEEGVGMGLELRLKTPWKKSNPC